MRRMFAEITGRMTQIHSYAYAANRRKAFEGLMCRFEAEQAETIVSALKEKIGQAMLDPSGYIIEMLTPILNEMKWSLAFAEHGYFITSDNPLVREVDPKNLSRLLRRPWLFEQDRRGLVPVVSQTRASTVLGWKRVNPWMARHQGPNRSCPQTAAVVHYRCLLEAVPVVIR